MKEIKINITPEKWQELLDRPSTYVMPPLTNEEWKELIAKGKVKYHETGEII